MATTQPQPDRQKQPERRKHKRVITDIGFAFVINGDEFVGKMGNISCSGAFLSDIVPELPSLLINQTGTLNIALDGEQLSLKSEVVYISTNDQPCFPAGAGIVFYDNDAETNAALLKLTAAFGLN